MIDPFRPGVGGVLSADIAVPRHEHVVRFYARVLGTGGRPLWRPDLMNAQGVPVIGLGARTAAYAHLPLQWMPHFQAADVSKSVASAQTQGGRVLLHAKDDSGASQWAVLADPNGAAFGVIPVQPDGARSPAGDIVSGRIVWLTLTTSAAFSTRSFYQEVVGWAVEEVEMEDERGPYVDFDLRCANGFRAARVRHARGNHAETPGVWLIHLPVGDLEESLRRTVEGGGTVVASPRVEPSGRLHAMIRDPVGAYIALASAGDQHASGAKPSR